MAAAGASPPSRSARCRLERIASEQPAGPGRSKPLNDYVVLLALLRLLPLLLPLLMLLFVLLLSLHVIMAGDGESSN